MTLAERDAFRRLILSELRASGVKIFQLSDTAVAAGPLTPLAGLEADVAVSADAKVGRVLSRSTTQPPPFAVCSSEDGTRVYPWGTCCVEDPQHSDLSTLRSMLFASSMVAAKRR